MAVIGWLLQLATAAATEALERACALGWSSVASREDSRRDSSSTRVLMFDVSYNGQFFSPSRAAQPKTQNPGRGAAQNPKPGPLRGPKPKTQNRRRGLTTRPAAPAAPLVRRPVRAHTHERSEPSPPDCTDARRRHDSTRHCAAKGCSCSSCTCHSYSCAQPTKRKRSRTYSYSHALAHAA